MSPSPVKPDATALVMPVPAADPLVSRWRARFDPSEPLGVPAHVTLLYPFVPPELVDEPTRVALAALFEPRPAVAVEFGRVARRDQLTYLPPEPPGALVDLTRAIVHRWPRYPPYRGRYGLEIVPHLSLGYGDPSIGHAAPTEAEHAEIVADLGPRLPLSAVLGDVWLLERRHDRWSVRASFALAGPR